MGGPGRLLAFEGIDGSGKTTQAARFVARVGELALATAEPGATPLGAELRRLVLDPGRPAVSHRAEALLMAADRAQHVEAVIAPALAAGRWVVTDRYAASTYAYQGAGRGVPLDELRLLVTWATAGLEPDLTVLVDLPVDVARRRRAGTAADRFEGLDGAFHRRVRDGYRSLAAADPDRWLVVDGAQAPDIVAGMVWQGVVDRLGDPTGPPG